jgi:hypothetical protein
MLCRRLGHALGLPGLAGDSVCLLFVDIPRLVYFELGLAQS